MALEVVGSNPTTHPIKVMSADIILGRSQDGKARDFDSRIRRFESCRPSHMTHSAGRAPDSPSECPAFESDGSPDKKSEDRMQGKRSLRQAGVAELADALDLGSSALWRGSSNLFVRTNSYLPFFTRCAIMADVPENKREWLSGRASPCHGECREFESRLPLHCLRP